MTTQTAPPTDVDFLDVRWRVGGTGGPLGRMVYTEATSQYVGTMASSDVARSVVNIHNAALKGIR